MADRVDFYFRQRVTEAELDLAFELLEQADRNLAADIGVYGVVSGAVPTQHSPVPDLTLDLSSPTRAYDRLGQRIFIGTDQRIDCSVDLVGIPTAVATPGNERWLALFLRFDRQLSDPRTDGNAQQVYFRRDESFEIVVRQAPEGPAGAGIKVALQQDELLICDLRLVHNQSQILDADIDLGRRQAFIFAQGDAVAIDSAIWKTLAPKVDTVQASFDDTDKSLTQHFSAKGLRHQAADIDFQPHAFLSEPNLQAALVELLDKLVSSTTSQPGAGLIGSKAIPGTPLALVPANVSHQLAQLLKWLNTHIAATLGAHHATSIAATPHAHIGAQHVQGQLEEIVADLESKLPSHGTAQVGSAAIKGLPHGLAQGTARSQLAGLLEKLNDHVKGGEHDPRYWLKSEQVDNAKTLDGKTSDGFATAGHEHDQRYMRSIYRISTVVKGGETTLLKTLGEPPELVTVSYNYLNSGVPEATTYVHGVHSVDLHAWVTKVKNGDEDKDYQLFVQNLAAEDLLVSVGAYGIST